MNSSISETTAIRLYNSVVRTNSSTMTSNTLPLTWDNRTAIKSIESIHSCNEFGNSCRICRWNRSDMQIRQIPCKCKGSVGFIHLQCLRRWIMQKQNSHCEICNEHFEMPDEKFNLKFMLNTFWSYCLVPICKNFLFGFSLIPLAHVILHQVFYCMEQINLSQQDQMTVSDVVVSSCSLLTSSVLFFHYFEYITTRFLVIRSILRHWWVFGNTNDFPLIEFDSEILDLF